MRRKWVLVGIIVGQIAALLWIRYSSQLEENTRLLGAFGVFNACVIVAFLLSPSKKERP